MYRFLIHRLVVSLGGREVLDESDVRNCYFLGYFVQSIGGTMLTT